MERLTKRFTDGTFYCEHIEDVGIKGINAPTYVGKVVDKLADYEDAEEQGLLLRLPCKVGDTVWWINSCYTFNGVKRVDEEIVKSFVFDEDGLTIVMSGIAMGELGKTVFLTKEEAEQALADMKGE